MNMDMKVKFPMVFIPLILSFSTCYCETNAKQLGCPSSCLNLLVEEKLLREKLADGYKVAMSKFEEEIQSVKADVFELQEGKQDTYNVAFHSVYIDSPRRIRSPQKVSFKHMTFNDGDAYDNTTGIFLAPLHGMYHFSLHLGTLAMGYMWLVKDDKSIDMVVSGEAGINEQASLSVGLELHKGNTVWIEAQHFICGQKPIPNDDPKPYRRIFRTTFSGYLVRALSEEKNTSLYLN